MASEIDIILKKLENLIRNESFNELETDTLEFKPVPPTGGEWKERHKSINAFSMQAVELLF